MIHIQLWETFFGGKVTSSLPDGSLLLHGRLGTYPGSVAAKVAVHPGNPGWNVKTG
jgi:hypothetical protein